MDEGANLFLLGTDEFGRDLYSRIIFAARISLFIGLFGIVISFVLGCVIGGISGYFGGIVDMVIQRLIEFLISIPDIPLWIALAAALPARWSSTRIYFAISAILAIIGWTGLARVVRGKLLELREADFVMAARISNMSDMKIIVRHLLPSFASYLIVSLSLGVPGDDHRRDLAELPRHRHPPACSELGRALAGRAKDPRVGTKPLVGWRRPYPSSS